MTSYISSKVDVETIWLKLKSEILNVAHRHIPHKSREKRSELWITTETIRELDKLKNYHFHRLKEQSS